MKLNINFFFKFYFVQLVNFSIHCKIFLFSRKKKYE